MSRPQFTKRRFAYRLHVIGDNGLSLKAQSDRFNHVSVDPKQERLNRKDNRYRASKWGHEGVGQLGYTPKQKPVERSDIDPIVDNALSIRSK
jgi:hypothetical protein